MLTIDLIRSLPNETILSLVSLANAEGLTFVELLEVIING